MYESLRFPTCFDCHLSILTLCSITSYHVGGNMLWNALNGLWLNPLGKYTFLAIWILLLRNLTQRGICFLAKMLFFHMMNSSTAAHPLCVLLVKKKKYSDRWAKKKFSVSISENRIYFCQTQIHIVTIFFNVRMKLSLPCQHLWDKHNLY